MEQLKRFFYSDTLFESLVIVWLLLSPLAIERWVQGCEDPVAWAAFVAGVLGVLIGWVVVAPQQLARVTRRPLS